MAEITIKSVEGNPLNINVVMTAVVHSMLNGEIITETVDFYPDTSKPVRAYLDCTTARKQFCPTTSVDGNIVYLSCDNATAGVYTLTVTCTDTNGKARRYKSDACIEVYDLTSAAEIAGTFDEQTYEMNGVFYTFGGGGATVQSDWDESNPESPAYIRNKPNLSDYATDEELQAVADTFNDSAAAQITDGDIEYWNNKSDFSGSYNDLSDKPTIPPAQVQSDWNQTNTSAKDYIKNKPTIPQGVVVDNALSSTSENPVQNKVINNALNGKQSTIADLNDIRNGAAAGATAYQKPSGGIPKSDLSSSVQTSLGKADTALQSYTESDPTIPSHVKAITTTDISNWNSKQNALTFDSTPTAGSNNPVTSAGIKAYVDNATPTITMDDTPTSGSSNPVKSSGIYNALQGKQNTLTFDSTPTASSSNPVTSGGVKTALDLKANQSTTYTKTEVDGLLEDVAYLSDDDGQATTLDFDPQADTVWNKAQTLSSAQKQQARENIGAAGINDITGMQVINHGTGDTTFALTPNKFHVWGEVASLTLTFATGEVGYIQEYIFQFTSGSTATTLNLPSSVKWITSNTVEANKTYQVSILNSLAVMGGA